MTKLFGLILTLAALYWFCAYWPNTVSNGALVTVQTKASRAINR